MDPVFVDTSEGRALVADYLKPKKDDRKEQENVELKSKNTKVEKKPDVKLNEVEESVDASASNEVGNTVESKRGT